MGKDGAIPDNNRSVIRMLSEEFGKYNKGRNRILAGAAGVCIVTLTMVLGIALGKVQAEYMRAARAAGTTASIRIENAGPSQYGKVRSLSYVKQAGRSITVGNAAREGNVVSEVPESNEQSVENNMKEEQSLCRICVLDATAWEEMIKPAYTDIHGHYPKEKQEIMLPVRSLKELGIEEPREGIQITLTVNIGLFRTEQEDFILSGWYTDYVPEQLRSETGYVSMVKSKEWGYDFEKESDILLCQTDSMDWRQAEERLYQDLAGNDSGLKITAQNTFAYDAVNQMVGSYGMAALGVLVVLSGMFFLIYNVMQISMTGDVRQMGLMNTIGATNRQIRRIYMGQIERAVIPGILVGTAVSAIVLQIVIPQALGKQYLSRYGGSAGLRIFRPEILAASAIFVVTLVMGAAACVIYRVVSTSCIESINITSTDVVRQKKRIRKSKYRYRRRSAGGEICYMAWRNLIRYRGQFILTVMSLFLGAEAFLGTVVITKGSDYVHVIEARPDFLIAGEFSRWGREQGYGNEYKTRDAGEDPMETEGNSFALLYGNEYDEFEPVSSQVREDVLSLEGVKKESSYVMEGAYMIAAISRKGIAPLIEASNLYGSNIQKEGVGYSYEYDMVEGADADVIQILKDEELAALKKYVEKKQIPIDIDSLIDGTGVAILHDHRLSPAQEKMAEASVGESVYFTAMWSRKERGIWEQMSSKERDAVEEDWRTGRKQSEAFRLSGYLDNLDEGFPDIRQTWHGSEGLVYYLISEKGFSKLPTEKKTLYMEVDVEEEKEPEIRAEIQDILIRENHRRDELAVVSGEDETGEAGIFCISRSDLLSEAANKIRGNRMILGSISVVLLFAGLMNYFNVMVTGILSRKKEFEVMESVGMTGKQKRMLLRMEGLYYCMIVTALMLSAGNGILKWIGIYMGKQLSYYVFSYPLKSLAVLIGCLVIICLHIPESIDRL